MANMTSNQRAECWADFMREMSAVRFATNGLSKTDLRAAIDAADAWCSSNAASYNTALPEPFKSTASSLFKSMLLRAVIRKRELTGN